jgi:hypothetical protein
MIRWALHYLIMFLNFTNNNKEEMTKWKRVPQKKKRKKKTKIKKTFKITLISLLPLKGYEEYHRMCGGINLQCLLEHNNLCFLWCKARHEGWGVDTIRYCPCASSWILGIPQTKVSYQGWSGINFWEYQPSSGIGFIIIIIIP